MNIFNCSIAKNKANDYGLHTNSYKPQRVNKIMRFGFFKYFLLAILLIVGGGFAWLALTDVPVQQQEMVVDVPLSAGQQ